MKNFSLFAGLGVFVCLSVGGRVDEWVLGQIKRAHKFDESKLYVLFEEQHIYGAFVYHSFLRLLLSQWSSMSSLCPTSLDLFIHLFIGESKFKNPS